MNPSERRDDPLRGLAPPRAPETLAARVLRAAADELTATPRPTVWDRLWNSRPLRWGWAVSTLGLVLAHLGLAVLPDAAPTRSAPRASVPADTAGMDEILNLPPFEISPRAERLCLGSRKSPPDRKKEKEEVS